MWYVYVYVVYISSTSNLGKHDLSHDFKQFFTHGVRYLSREYYITAYGNSGFKRMNSSIRLDITREWKTPDVDVGISHTTPWDCWTIPHFCGSMSN